MVAPLSPCINICVIDHDTGLCDGCRRTLGEIAAWGGMSDEERRRVMAMLATRTISRPERNGDAA